MYINLDKAPTLYNTNKLLAPKVDYEESKNNDMNDGTILLSPYSKYNGNDMIMSPMLRQTSFISSIRTSKSTLSRNYLPDNPSILPIPKSQSDAASSLLANPPSNQQSIIRSPFSPSNSPSSSDIMISCLKSIDNNTLDIRGPVLLYNIALNQYEEKYLFFKDFHLLWCDTKPETNKGIRNTADLAKFNGFIHIFCIRYIDIVDSNKNTNGYEFTIYTTSHGNGNNNTSNAGQYLFKCNSKQKRNKWIDDLNKYCLYLIKTIDTLQNSDVGVFGSSPSSKNVTF